MLGEEEEEGEVGNTGSRLHVEVLRLRAAAWQLVGEL